MAEVKQKKQKKVPERTKEFQKKLARAQDLLDQGLSLRQIGKKVGRSTATIKWWIRKGYLVRKDLATIQAESAGSDAQDTQADNGASASPFVDAQDPPGNEAAEVEGMDLSEELRALESFEWGALELPNDLSSEIIYTKFGQDGKADKIMVNCFVAVKTPVRSFDFIKLPYSSVRGQGIYPARFGNSWIYPIIIRDGQMYNWPRAPVPIRASAKTLWWARDWPEWDAILANLTENWGKLLTGGIVAVIVLTLLVIFLLLFFFFLQ